ncbi:hypothetical protein DBR06_SOUSAS210412, partial [Sousa chinensis]
AFQSYLQPIDMATFRRV